MFLIIWSIISFTLLSFIIVRPPKRIGIKSVTTITALFGSPTEAEKTLNILTISLSILAIIFSIPLEFC